MRKSKEGGHGILSGDRQRRSRGNTTTRNHFLLIFVILDIAKKKVMKKNIFKKYAGKFSESHFWQKLNKYARQAGTKAVYTALLLFYAYDRNDTPGWAKRIVLGSLGYLITPIDALPDLTPILGYTDDLGVLSFGLVTIAAYINQDVKQNAREKLQQWFGSYNPEDLAEIDDKL